MASRSVTTGMRPTRWSLASSETPRDRRLVAVARSPRRVPHRHVAADQAPSRPRHDRVPLRPGSSTTTSTRRSATSRCADSGPITSTPSTTSSSTTGGRHGSGLAAEDGARGPHDRAVLARLGRAPPARRPQRRSGDQRPAPAPDPQGPAARGPPQELATFLSAARRNASTRRCTSPHAPGCAAVRSSGSSGPTSTGRTDASRSAAPFKASPANPSSSRSRPAPAAAASISTTTPSTSSLAGDDDSAATDSPTTATTGCSATPTGRFVNPESISQLFDRIVNAGSRTSSESVSTTCATPTPRC